MFSAKNIYNPRPLIILNSPKQLIMKKYVLILLIALIGLKSFGQADTVKTGSKMPGTDYSELIQKSKNQKAAAWALLGGGTVMTVAGLILWNNENEKRAKEDTWGYVFSLGYNDWIILSAAGIIAATAGSIPLFVASRKNKRKANALSMSFKIEKTFFSQSYNLTKVNYPALSLKINL
jgi:hypothetical protein